MEKKDKAADGADGKPAAEVPVTEEVVPGADGVVDATGEKVTEVTPGSDKGGKKTSFIYRILTRLNIYFLLFLLLAVIGGGTVFVAFQLNKKQAPTTGASSQLSGDALNKLTNTDTKIGDAKQNLTFESNATFDGKVLVRDSLDVAGGLKVGGSLSLTGLNVAGQSSFDQVLLNKLSVTGDASIQGQLTVQKNLTISGEGSFAGPISAPKITTDVLQLNKDLQISKHIDAGGPSPGVARGTATGNGGTVSISGTDTAGTVTINVGGSPAAGILASVTFSTPFGGTPHVVITPVGSGAASVQYYITRTTTGFTISCANVPPGGTFSFDYIAVD